MEVSLLAVFLAAVAAYIVGFLWYSDFLFGKIWRREMGMEEGGMKGGMGKMIVFGFIATLVMSYVLANLIVATVAINIPSALVLGAWLWVGFMVPIMMGGVLYEKKSCKLFFINASHYLIAILVMSAILSKMMV